MIDGLLTLREILAPAQREGFAVGAFTVASAETADAVLAAAQAERSPVILMLGPMEIPLLGADTWAAIIRTLARNYDVPVCLHLDHALELDLARQALEAGFPSVMVDRSDYPLEQNLQDTGLIVELARRTGASVEAEIGHVGLADGASSEMLTAETCLTDPEEAERFARDSGVDALAVSVGTAHGLGAGLPELRFELLAEIERRVSVPLVLHGATGRSAEQIRRAIRLGVRKINVASELAQIIARTLGAEIEAGGGFIWLALGLAQVHRNLQPAVRAHQQIMGCAGRAGLYRR